MDRFDAAILEFARRWLPFGGPRSEDVLVEFGMTTDRYNEHLTRILDAVIHDLPADVRAGLRRTIVERSVSSGCGCGGGVAGRDPMIGRPAAADDVLEPVAPVRDPGVRPCACNV